MKKSRSYFKVMVMLAMTLFVVWTSVSYVQADLGCHPEYRIRIENLPGGYYCAIISNNGSRGATMAHDFWDNRENRNSEFHLDQVDMESVKEYLSKFYYEGWCYYQDTLLFNSQGPWLFSGWENPFPGRILFISPDGEVTMSESMVDHKDYTYDFQKGGWATSNKLGYFGSLLKYLLICYILTLLIEYSIFGSFIFGKVPGNRKKFLFINTVTNIPMNFMLYNVYTASDDMELWLKMYFSLEVIVLLGESIYYSLNLVDQKGEKRPKIAFACGAIANFCSAAVGIIYTMFDLNLW